MIGLFALVTSSVFFGAAVFINIAEQPARLRLDDDGAWTQWGPSYKRGFAMQASTAVVSGLCGLGAWWESGNLLFLVGAVLILANWPYTLIAILPVNKQIEAMNHPVSSTFRPLLIRWGRLHAGRSLLGTLATISYIGAVIGAQ